MAENFSMGEEIPKRNHDQRVVSLCRTLLTFFRQKVSARRVGEKTKDLSFKFGSALATNPTTIYSALTEGKAY